MVHFYCHLIFIFIIFELTITKTHFCYGSAINTILIDIEETLGWERKHSTRPITTEEYQRDLEIGQFSSAL
jgi:hypothetical protein